MHKRSKTVAVLCLQVWGEFFAAIDMLDSKQYFYNILMDRDDYHFPLIKPFRRFCCPSGRQSTVNVDESLKMERCYFLKKGSFSWLYAIAGTLFPPGLSTTPPPPPLSGIWYFKVHVPPWYSLKIPLYLRQNGWLPPMSPQSPPCYSAPSITIAFPRVPGSPPAEDSLKIR